MRPTSRLRSSMTVHGLLATAAAVVTLALSGCAPDAGPGEPEIAPTHQQQRGSHDADKLDREEADPFGFRDGDARKFRDGFRQIRTHGYSKHMMGGQEGEPIYSGGVDAMNPLPPPEPGTDEDEDDADPDDGTAAPGHDDVDTGLQDTGL